jgi:hypothetical protein
MRRLTHQLLNVFLLLMVKFKIACLHKIFTHILELQCLLFNLYMILGQYQTLLASIVSKECIKEICKDAQHLS